MDGNLSGVFQTPINTLPNTAQITFEQNSSEILTPNDGTDTFVSSNSNNETNDTYIDLLIRTFSNSNETISERQNAMRTLNTRGESLSPVVRARAATALISVLNNRNTTSELQATAAGTLYGIGQDLPQAVRESAVAALVPLLSNHDWHVQAAAAEALGSVGKDSFQAVIALIPLRLGSNRLIRGSASTALGRILENSSGAIKKEAFLAVIPLLSNSNNHIRDTAESITDLLYPILYSSSQTLRNQMVRKLIPLLSNSNIGIMFNTIKIIYMIRAPGNFPPALSGEVVTALTPLITNDADFVRRETANLLGLVGSDLPEAARLLIGVLSDPEEPVRVAASNALVALGQTAVPELIQQFGNIPSLTIANLFLRMEQRATTNGLVRALNHANPMVQANVIRLLGRIIYEGTRLIDPRVGEISNQRFNEIIGELHSVVISARRYGTTRAENREPRIAAIETLGLIGQRAVPVLTDIANNNLLPQDLRSAAADTLNEINTK